MNSATFTNNIDTNSTIHGTPSVELDGVVKAGIEAVERHQSASDAPVTVVANDDAPQTVGKTKVFSTPTVEPEMVDCSTGHTDSWFVSTDRAKAINGMVRKAVNKETTRKKVGRQIAMAAGGLGYVKGLVANAPRLLDQAGIIRQTYLIGEASAEFKFDEREAKYNQLLEDARSGKLLESNDLKSPKEVFHALLKMGVTYRDAKIITKEFESEPQPGAIVSTGKNKAARATV